MTTPKFKALLFVLLASCSSLLAPAADGAPAPGDLEQRLARIATRVGGKLGVSVIHVESGRTATFNGSRSLPLYSVFKLPLAVVVLGEVEAGRLELDERLVVTPDDLAPGGTDNTKRWARLPMETTPRRLLELSLVESDNTSTDKLLDRVGGPAFVTRRMRELGFGDIEVKASVKELWSKRSHPNRGSAEALSELLAALQRGTVLAPAQRDVLWEMMARSRTGARRLRAGLPAGTPVLDKTGSGSEGASTNDVGVLTLPGGFGNLAIAVLIADSELPAGEQEAVIAEIARAAYDAYLPLP